MFLFMDSFMTGIEEESVRNYRNHETGDFQVLARGWWEKREELPLDYLIEDTQRVEEALEGLAYTPHIDFIGEMIFSRGEGFLEEGSLYVQPRAIDPEGVGEVFTQFGDIVEGRMLQKDEEGVLLGSWFARELGARVGAQVNLSVTGRYGGRDFMTLEVVGIINSPDSTLNRQAFYLPLGVADYYLEMEGAVTGYSVKGRPESLETLQAALPPQGAYLSFEDLTYAFQALGVLRNGFVGIMVLFIFIIAYVGVSNTLMISLYERRFEIGMMRSFGMGDGQIILTFVWEAMGIGLLGVLIALLLALPLNAFMVNHGIDYSFILDDFSAGYRTTGVLKGVWKPLSFGIVIPLGMVLAGITALWPSVRILRRSIPENLKGA